MDEEVSDDTTSSDFDFDNNLKTLAIHTPARRDFDDIEELADRVRKFDSDRQGWWDDRRNVRRGVSILS